MKGFVAVRFRSHDPRFLTKGDGWTNNVLNAVVFPSIVAAKAVLRSRPAEIVQASEIIDEQQHQGEKDGVQKK